MDDALILRGEQKTKSVAVRSATGVSSTRKKCSCWMGTAALILVLDNLVNERKRALFAMAANKMLQWVLLIGALFFGLTVIFAFPSNLAVATSVFVLLFGTVAVAAFLKARHLQRKSKEKDLNA